MGPYVGQAASVIDVLTEDALIEIFDLVTGPVFIFVFGQLHTFTLKTLLLSLPKLQARPKPPTVIMSTQVYVQSVPYMCASTVLRSPITPPSTNDVMTSSRGTRAASAVWSPGTPSRIRHLHPLRVKSGSIDIQVH